MGAPIGHTCPSIDRVIEAIKEAYKSSDEVSALINNEPTKEELDDIRYYNDIIINNLYRLEDEMEDIRRDNSSLRNWGEEQEAKANELEEELETIEV